jgi:KDO2-lipid IV(A) lauroyltransferase
MTRYWIFRIAAAVIPHVPVAIARPLALATGFLIWLLAPGMRRRAERNLRHIPALAAHPDRLYAATRGVFQHMALNYLDFFRGTSISDQELRSGWTIENQQAFDVVMAQGRGLIIFTGHLGNFEFGASRLGALGYNLTAPAEHMEPDVLFQLFCRLREHHRLRVVPADSRDSLRELLDALKRGEIVIFLADRYILGSSVVVPFFGEPARLPTGPFALAARSGVPMMAVFSWREGPGRSYGVFTPLDVNASAPAGDASTEPGSGGAPSAASSAALASTATATRARSGEQALRLQRLFLDELEKRVAAHPEQWVSALSPIWEDT